MTTVIKRSLMVSALLTVLLVLLGGGIALAADPPDTSNRPEAMITLQELQQEKSAGTITIRARLSGDQPLGNQPVDFFVAADYFGEQEVYLDTVITDATGTAVLNYRPKWQGTHVVTARFQGDDQNAAVETTLSFQVAEPVVAYKAEPVGLMPVRNWTPVVVGLGVAMVWALLLFVAFRTLRGISQARG